MIYIKRLNLCFIEIPKTASSSIRSFLLNEVYNSAEDFVTDFNHYTSRYVIRNNLVPKDSKFIGVIREPLERQLSAYLYAYCRRSSIVTQAKLDHFKEICKAGFSDEIPSNFISGLGKVAAASQSSYINRNLNHEFWLYENLDKYIDEFKNKYKIKSDTHLERINQTYNDSTVETKRLVDVFYDEELKNVIRKQYADDFKLYNELKDGRYPR